MNVKKIVPVIGVVIFFVLIQRVGVTNVVASIAQVHLGWLALSICALYIHLLLITIKWWLVFPGSANSDYNWWQLFRVKMIGTLYSSLTPMGAGTFFSLPHIRNHFELSSSQAALTIFLDKVLEIGALLILAFSGLLFYTQVHQSVLFLGGIFFLSFLVAVAVQNVHLRFLKNPLFRTLFKHLPTSTQQLTRRSLALLEESSVQRSKLMVAFLTNVAGFLVSYVFAYWLAIGLTMNISFWQLASSLAIVSLVNLLPISISGIGTRDITLVYLWSGTGITPASIVALSTLLLVLGKGIPSALGVLGLIEESREQPKP